MGGYQGYRVGDYYILPIVIMYPCSYSHDLSLLSPGYYRGWNGGLPSGGGGLPSGVGYYSSGVKWGVTIWGWGLSCGVGIYSSGVDGLPCGKWGTIWVEYELPCGKWGTIWVEYELPCGV